MRRHRSNHAEIYIRQLHRRHRENRARRGPGGVPTTIELWIDREAPSMISAVMAHAPEFRCAGCDAMIIDPPAFAFLSAAPFGKPEVLALAVCDDCLQLGSLIAIILFNVQYEFDVVHDTLALPQYVVADIRVRGGLL
jgi:hypothetical protein